MCLYSYQKYFTLSPESEKHVTERNKRLNLSGLFIDWRNQFLISPNWIIENNLCQILCMVLEFIGLFLWCLGRKEQIGSTLNCPNLAKWISFSNCFSKMTSLKMFISPVTEKLERSNLDSNKHHWKGSIGYSTSVGSDVISL